MAVGKDGVAAVVVFTESPAKLHPPRHADVHLPPVQRFLAKAAAFPYNNTPATLENDPRLVRDRLMGDMKNTGTTANKLYTRYADPAVFRTEGWRWNRVIYHR